MKVVDHMTTIPEGCVLDSNNVLVSPYNVAQLVQNSRPSSPMLSPSKPRRIQNMLLGVRTPLCASKSSIDGFKVGSVESKHPGQHINFAHSLTGVGLNKEHYVESWIAGSSSSNSRADGSHNTLPSSSAPPTPQSPADETTLFHMDVDDGQSSKPTSSYDIKGMRLENPDVTRVRHIESGSNPRRFTVLEHGNVACAPALEHSNDETDGAVPSQPAPPPSYPAAINDLSHPGVVESSTAPSASNPAATCDDDIPEIVIDTSMRTRHTSASFGNTSSSSIPNYEQVESHQCTVSSLTPLLDTSTSSSDLAV